MSLQIKNLSASFQYIPILKDVNLEIKNGEIHAIMGPNGSGKSTLAQVLMGNENYKLQSINYKLELDKIDLRKLKTEERARMGLFLAFQNPIAIPGVSVASMLRVACQDNSFKKNKGHNPVLSVLDFNKRLYMEARELDISADLLRRGLNDGFSGGEKKKLEMLQVIMIKPKYAIFDEIDTGLDVDALKIVAKGINKLKEISTGIIIITHYMRILKFAKPDKVSILINGKIIKTGDYHLAEEIEKEGYKKWTI